MTPSPPAGSPIPDPLPPAPPRRRPSRGVLALVAALLTGLLVAVLLLAAVQLGSPPPEASSTSGANATATVPATAGTSDPAASARATDSPAATASPSGTVDSDALEAEVAEITAQVAAIRGLEPLAEIPTSFLTSAEFRERVEADFREQYTPEYLEASNQLYRRLRLIPPDADLEELTLEVLEASVIGVYFPDEQEMAVVGSMTTVGPAERFTLAHEIDHALQDQHFDLDEVLDVESASTESDRTLARQALIEGDATQLMVEWAREHLTQAELFEVASQGLDPEQQEVLARMPPILQRQLTFPYLDGQQFVSRLGAQGGWEAVNAAWAEPPDSTEQILHPDAYAARDEPLDVALPDLSGALGAGWTRTLEDTFGELQMQVWLQGVAPDAAAVAATAGWGGDRIESWEGPDDQWVIAWQTAWDSPADTREFVNAASLAETTISDPLTIISSEAGESAVVIIASESTLLDRVAAVFDSI